MRDRIGMACLVVACVVLGALAISPQLAGAQPSSAQSSPADFSGVKNVILFIGDGMGPKEVELGKLMGDGTLWTDAAPWTTGRLTTSSLDGVTDSAAASTALATGVETYNGWLSRAPDGTPVETVLERAESKGKATGLVSTDADSGATPAGFASHVRSREQKLAITAQIVGQGVEALLSSSWSWDYLLERRSGVSYAENSTALAPYLTGQIPWPTSLYAFPGQGDRSMSYVIDREETGAVGVQPMLSELTAAALGVLGQEANGFFLMVEGAKIDWCATQRDAACTAAEVVEFDRAIQAGVDYASDRTDTLVLVTADHETGGLSFGSGVDRSVVAGQTASSQFMWRQIKLGRSTPSEAMATYAGITDLTGAERRSINTYDDWRTMMAISDVLAARENVTWASSGPVSADHTGTPVPVYAFGPGQEAFAGRYENERVGILLLDAISQ